MLCKVSIIIPCNKNRGWLYDCIKSIYLSDYKGAIEVILSKSDSSVSYNINRAIELCTGDYIKFIAEDDMITSNCISDSIKAFNCCDVICGKAYYLENGFLTGTFEGKKDVTLSNMLQSNIVHGGTLMYKASVLKANLFDESLWTGEEYELNLRLLSKGFTFGYCDSFLTYNRQHELQKSIGNKASEYQKKRSIEIERIKQMYR
jgi:glycosyltransferase involved in cell wall biosynthesis